MSHEVPLYKQSYGYSCGPASLLMVLGGMDASVDLSIETEVSIWEDANLLESKATSSYGLALAALKRGFDAKVRASDDDIGFTRRLKEHFPAIDVSRMKEHFRWSKELAREMGLHEEKGHVTLRVLEDELREGRTPIVLISSRLMREIVPIPHWVVVVGIDNKKVEIANPETKKLEKYSIRKFKKHLGFDGHTCMVCIFGRTERPQVLKTS